MATPIQFNVTGNVGQGVAAANQMSVALAKLQSQGQATAASVSRINSVFSRLGVALASAFAASAVVRGMKRVVDAASDVQVSSMAVTSVFKDQASVVLAAASNYEQYGLSIAEFNQNAARLGAQQKSLGTTQDKLASQTLYLMNVGSDLAATFGGDVSDAVHALSAAFRNEYDPIEKYGVTMKATTVTALQASEGLTRSQAVLRLLWEQTRDVQGQAERQIDSYAIKSKRLGASFQNLQASIGEGLMPAATVIVDVLGDLASAGQAVPQGLTQAATAAALFGTGLAAVNYAGGKAQSGLAKLAGSLRSTVVNLDLAANAATAASKNIRALGIAALVVGAGIAAANAGTNKFEKLIGKTAKSGDELRTVMLSIADGTTEITDSSAILGDKFYDFDKMINSVFNRSIISNINAFATQVGSLGGALPWGRDSVDDAREYFSTVDTGLQELASSGRLNEAIKVYEQLRAALDGMGVSQEQLQQQLPQFAQALQANGIAFQDVESATIDAAAAYEGLADAAETALASINALNGITSGVTGSMIDYKASIDAVRASVDEYGKNTNINTEAGRANVQALDDQATSANKVFNAMANAGKSTEAITSRVQSARQAFIASAEAIGYSSTKAQKLADDYGLIPDVVLTELRQKGYEEAASAANDVNQAIRDIPQSYYVQIIIEKIGTPSVDWKGAAEEAKSGLQAFTRPWEVNIPKLGAIIRKGVLKGLGGLKKDLREKAQDQWKAYVDAAKDQFREFRRITLELIQQRKQMRANLRDQISAFSISDMLAGVKTAQDEIARLQDQLANDTWTESWSHLTDIEDQLRAAQRAAVPDEAKIAELQRMYAVLVKEGPRRIKDLEKAAELEKQIVDLRSKDTLKEQIQSQVDQTQQFATALKRLRTVFGKDGSEALKQIVAAGPEAGLELAEALLNDKALAEQFEKAYKNIRSIARQPAELIAQDEYYKKIKNSIKDIYKLQKTWAKDAIDDLDKWLAKRGKKTIELEFVTADAAKKNKKNDSTISSAKQGDTFNITINGAIDPEGTARAVKKVLAQHGRRTGTVAS